MRSKSFITLMQGYIFNILFYSDESVAYAGFAFNFYLNTTSTQTTTTTVATTTTKATTTIAATTTGPTGSLEYKFKIMIYFYGIISSFMDKTEANLKMVPQHLA